MKIADSKLTKYITDIEFAAKFFNEHFIKKQLIYSSQSQSITVQFIEANFMHLCGIKYSDGASAFFNTALSKKIDLKKVKVKSDGSTFQKLQVLKYVQDLINPKLIRLTESAVYLNLHFDKALKTKKQVFALTLQTRNNDYFFPNSLINLKYKNQFPVGEPVRSIKSIDLQTHNVFIYSSEN